MTTCLGGCGGGVNTPAVSGLPDIYFILSLDLGNSSMTSPGSLSIQEDFWSSLLVEECGMDGQPGMAWAWHGRGMGVTWAWHGFRMSAVSQ